MPVMDTSWDVEAQVLGYEHEREMLDDLYFTHGMSLAQLGRVLAKSTWAVRRRLRMVLRKPLRPRGGPNNADKRKLASISDDDLFNYSPKEIATAHNCHLGTVFAERRLRKGDTTNENSTDLRTGRN